jgi:hypothetical protein
MITYRFPTNVSLTEVTQDYVIQRENLLGIKLMPFVRRDTQIIEWDELDFEIGMTAPHNMNTDPKIGGRPGSKTHKYTPLFFKETDLLKESDFLMPRAMGTLGGVIDMSAEIARPRKLERTRISCALNILCGRRSKASSVQRKRRAG